MCWKPCWRLQSVEPVAGFVNAKNINPQWGSDGGTLYFLSDRGGITNAYRLTIGTGDLRQVTNLQTGITGITASSPALSVDRTSGETHLRHRITPDGFYRGKRVIEKPAEVETEE